MDDTPFGLSQPSTYASLSAQDLDSMGKRAALCFLEEGVPLNDAVVKLAKECPNISSHQIQRVVEFANNHTFSKVFEKQAGDKNIEFPVADPSVVMKELDNGARPSRMETAPDYGKDPVKTAHAAVEHDAILMEAFGFDLATPGTERTAINVMQKTAGGDMRVVDTILRNAPSPGGAPADRILMHKQSRAMGTPSVFMPGGALEHGLWGALTGKKSGKKKVGMAPMQMVAPQEEAPAETTTQQHPEITHRANIRAMDRRIEIEKKKQELVSMQAKGMQVQGDMGGAPEGSAPPPGPPPGPPPESGMPPPEAGAPAEGMPPGGEGGVPAGGQPPMAGPPMPPPGPPPGLPGGMPYPMDEQRKMGSALVKQAMAYAKSGRPRTRDVLSDLEKGASLERIKAAVSRDLYPQDNPHGELIRTKQKLARMMTDLERSCGHNQELRKQAAEEFGAAVVEHLYSGGSMGEVAHAMEHVGGTTLDANVALKTASVALERHGFDLPKLQAQAIVYEMEKGASVRALNPQHPLIQTYASLCKISEKQGELTDALQKVSSSYAEAHELVGKAVVNGVASL